jgi:hypothetical protein
MNTSLAKSFSSLSCLYVLNLSIACQTSTTQGPKLEKPTNQADSAMVVSAREEASKIGLKVLIPI